MKKMPYRNILSILIIAILLNGCVSGKLTQKDIAQIQRVALQVELNPRPFRVFNRSPSAVNNAGAVMLGGVLGGAIGAIAMDAAVGHKSRIAAIKSLNKSPKSLGEISFQKEINEIVHKTSFSKLSTFLPIVNPEKMKEMGLSELAEIELDSGEMAIDYTPWISKLGVDTVIKINYSYGLTIYKEDTPPAASIFAYVKIINIKDGSTILFKVLSSDSIYRESHEVTELIDNSGSLFKAEVSKAAEEIAYMIGLEFGKDISKPKKSYWETYVLSQGS